MKTKEPEPKSAWDRARSAGTGIGRGLLTASRRTWLAGLGTLAAVDERARDAFSTLVEHGEELEQRVAAPATLQRASSRVRTLRKNLETQAERGVTSALHLVGLPTYRDINTLIDRVEKLTQRVESLGR